MDERTKAAGTDEVEIDLLELAAVVWHKLWLIVIGLLVGAAGAYALVTFAMTPKYKATTTIYIFSKTTSISSMADLQIGSSLTEDFQIIAKTRGVIETAIRELENEGKLEMYSYSYDSLVSRVTITNPASSHMLRVTVEDTDPIRAANFSNKISDLLREQISEIMNTDRPSVVESALPPQNAASPNVVRDTMLGAMLGAMLMVALIVIRHLGDDTIKTSDDVHKYLGLDVLAEFPLIRGRNGAESGAG